MNNEKYSSDTDEKIMKISDVEKMIENDASNDDNQVKDLKNYEEEAKKDKVKVKRTVYDENAPYDNASVWAAWFFFWPIAWWILSYISLKNLWYKHAKYVLLWSFIITIIISYIIMFIIPDTSNIQLWFLWLIFMLFQQKQVKKWENTNPDIKHKSWFKAFGWGLVWLGIFFIISFVIAFFTISGNWLIDEYISVNEEYPMEVNIWDTFNMEFSIRNIDNLKHDLYTIDFDNNFLDGIIISDSTPKFLSENEIYWMQQYEFKTELPGNTETKVIINAKAIKKWDFWWDLDFCIDEYDMCLFNSIRIVVK